MPNSSVSYILFKLGFATREVTARNVLITNNLSIDFLYHYFHKGIYTKINKDMHKQMERAAKSRTAFSKNNIILNNYIRADMTGEYI